MGKSIDIIIGGKVVGRVVGGSRVGEVAALLEGEQEVFVVYDRQAVWVAEAVGRAVAVRGSLALTVSEAAKSMDTVLSICRWLLESGASRKALVVAIGGGITTDMAGFAASIYKRGIRYANLPTTLLAQVDAAVGGKTGVNFDAYKNMLGVIVQPVFTFLCAEVLRTLPRRDFLSGAAELVKTFLIEDHDGHYARSVRLLAARDVPGCFPLAPGAPSSPSADTAERVPSTDSDQHVDEKEWQELVFAAAAVKAGVVGRDPFERGERRKLNLGHTFAHAIEHEARLRGDDITHGEAVAMGINLAARLSDGLGLAQGLAGRLMRDFAAAGLPVACPYPLETLAEAMGRDKKAEGGRVHFVLLRGVGDVVIIDLTVEEALRTLQGGAADKRL